MKLGERVDGRWRLEEEEAQSQQVTKTLRPTFHLGIALLVIRFRSYLTSEIIE